MCQLKSALPYPSLPDRRTEAVPLKQSIPVRLRYGCGQEFSCEVESNRVSVFRPGPAELSPSAAREAIQKTLASPLGLPTLDQALVPDDHVVIALERHTPAAATIVAAIWQWLDRRAIAPDQVTILHPAGVDSSCLADPRVELPESVATTVQWKTHDPTDDQSCAYVATTSAGERIYLARELVEADFVLPVGMTAFDPLLGYRGTHSVLYPGLSTIEALAKTVGQGHRELAPRDTRPLRQLVDEIAWLMGLQFSVQVVAATGEGIVEVLAGSADAVFKQCSDLVDDHWMITLPERVETVVVAVPQDASGHGWQQIGQALATARQLVESEGRIVILSEISEDPGEGLTLLCECDEPLEALQPLRQSRPQDLFVASQLAGTTDWARVYLLSNLEEDLVEDLFMFPLESSREVERIVSSSKSCALIGAAQRTFGLVD
jgi:nickel-dependent lactate racemase